MTDAQTSDVTAAERMAALARLQILDTPPEIDFDDVALLASEICQTPVALVTLVAEDRQWFKARLGFPRHETALDQSVCRHVLTGTDVLVIPDLRHDPRTAGNTLVTDSPFLRFYAGAPLHDAGGIPVGALCVIDTAARPGGLTESQAAGLHALARQVSTLLETRRRLLEQGRWIQEEHVRLTSALMDQRHQAERREQSIAVLSHDLRNPLAAIDAGLRLLTRDSGPRHVAYVITMLKQSVMRMTRLIETTLDFARARLGGGLDVVHAADTPLEPVLEQVIAELRLAHPEMRLESRFDLAHPVTCDPERLAQLASNLVANAWMHGDATKPLEVTARTEDEAFTLSVANQGAPIPPAVQERLFQPFAPRATSGRFGLGLGLFIASQISRAHGGTLSATSTPERTCFTFRMPLRAGLQDAV